MKPSSCYRSILLSLSLALIVSIFPVVQVAAAHDAKIGHAAGDATAGDAAVYLIRANSEQLGPLREEFDIWGYQWRDGHAVALLSPAEVQQLEQRGFVVFLDAERTATQLLSELSSELSSELPGLPHAAQGGGIPSFPCYRTVEETFADLAQRAANQPSIARWIDLGDSWEKVNTAEPGYDIRALVLTNTAVLGAKPSLVVMAAMHAREYTTAETVTRFAELLLDGYGTNPDITWLLDYHRIHIIPHLNPDGRKRAETGLFWRKNADNDFCGNSNNRGIDLNRNASFLWGSGGGNACGETFRGPSAASEPETQAVENYLAAVFPDQRGDGMNDPAPADAEGVFISVHSFSELVLFPWEATNANSPNHDQLQTLGRKFGFYNDYAVCQDCLGTASGTTVDEAYGEYGVAAYTFELGNNFFESCSPFESTILPRNLDALLYAAKAARRPYQESKGPEAVSVVATPGTVEAGQPVTLTATLDDSRYDSNGFGTEPVQDIAAAFYSIDVPAWQQGAPSPMAPVDGTFDASSEAVTAALDTTGLSSGQHLVYVFGEDADGNRGVPTAVFLNIAAGPIFVDNFDSGTTDSWSAVVP